MADPAPIVTLGGECFEPEPSGSTPSPRFGTVHFFHLVDLKSDRGRRPVSVFVPGGREADKSPETRDACLNAIRRAFDLGQFSFDRPYDARRYYEIPWPATEMEPQLSARDSDVRQLIFHKAYWLSYRYGGLLPVRFDEPIDVAYLGVTQQDVIRNVWLLGQRGLLEKTEIPGVGRPSGQLVDQYENGTGTRATHEQVFPAGTQFDAFRAVKKIFASAERQILIADNYINDDVLAMIGAAPRRLKVRLLTFRPAADLQVAVSRFRAQYSSEIEIRLHGAQIHDRVIAVDDERFFALGASIKGMGDKLSIMSKLDEPEAIERLRKALEEAWSAGKPLS